MRFEELERILTQSIDAVRDARAHRLESAACYRAEGKDRAADSEHDRAKRLGEVLPGLNEAARAVRQGMLRR